MVESTVTLPLTEYERLREIENDSVSNKKYTVYIGAKYRIRTDDDIIKLLAEELDNKSKLLDVLELNRRANESIKMKIRCEFVKLQEMSIFEFRKWRKTADINFINELDSVIRNNNIKYE